MKITSVVKTRQISENWNSIVQFMTIMDLHQLKENFSTFSLTGDVDVLLGVINIDKPTQRIKSKDVILHDNWDRTTFSNNIALIILAHRISLNSEYPVILKKGKI